MPLNLPGVARDNTMVVSLHKDAGDPAKRWFRFRRNTIMEAWKPAWDAAQEGKYGQWFEARIEGRLERVR